MKTETFSKLQAILEGHIAACRFYLGNVSTTEDLKSMTIKDAQNLLNFCRQEEGFQTKFAQCDLYHLIGLGNLTPPQMMKLTYLAKDWLQYRPLIKTIAMNFDKVSQLPHIASGGSYKMKTMDLVLSSSVEETTFGELPYTMSGNMIQVLQKDLPKFINFWRVKAKTPFSVSTFEQRLKASAEYGGVRWTVDNNNNFVGIIKQDNAQQLFEGCMRAAQENLT